MNDNDSDLAFGAIGDEMFANAEGDKTAKRAAAVEDKRLAEILPTAESQLASIDAELVPLNRLTDFYLALQFEPTDMQESDLRVKLEVNYGKVAYLLNKRNLIVSALTQNGADPDKYALKPAPLTALPRLHHCIPRPTGWAAIRAGIRDLFGGAPMQ
jgi:hypothetical protein